MNLNVCGIVNKIHECIFILLSVFTFVKKKINKMQKNKISPVFFLILIK